MSILHLICYRSTVVQVLFCSLKKGNYPEMCMLCFVLINTILVNLLMRLDLNEQHIDFNCKCAFGDKFGVLCWFVEYVFCYADGVLFVMHHAVVSLLVLRGGIEVADLLPVEDVVTVLK